MIEKEREMSAKYVVGIDLGTTNCVLAYVEIGSQSPQVELVEIPQLVAANTIESRATLPSFLYIAPEHEAAAGGG
jgi:molecular chaperone DnaK (HSP70)